MFEIGFWEIVLLFVVALVVVGPERLPALVRTAGLWIGKARRIVAEFKDEVDRELRVDELKRSIRQQDTFDEMRKLADRVKSINSEITTIQTDIAETLQSNNNKSLPKTNSLPKVDSSAPNSPMK